MTVRMLTWGRAWWRTVFVSRRTVAACLSVWTVWRPSVSGRDGGPLACCAGCGWCPGMTGHCAPAGKSGMVCAVVLGGVRGADCERVGAWVVLRASCSNAVVPELV